MNFSIVIPVYNEKKNIVILIKEITECIDEKFKYEIIIVDDCSDDGSKETLSKLSKEENLNVIFHNKNMGQSFSILTGIKRASYKNILTIDGDLQNDPRDINMLLYKYFENGYDLVAGIRKKRKDSYIKIISSVLANYIRSLILKDDCKDTGCSLKIFSKEIFLNFPFFNGIHRFLPALYKGYNKNIYFVNVNHRYRVHGKSKYGTIDRLIRGIYDTIKVYKIINNNNKKS